MTAIPPSRPDGGFPTTVWSVILSLRDPANPEYQDKMNRLILRYWKPVFQAIRAGWARQEEEARDLTQEFFLLLLEGDVLEAADPERGSFRRYLRTVLRHFLINRKEAAKSQKRGGTHRILSLDFEGVGPRLEPSTSRDNPEVEFDRAWAHQLLTEAMAEIEKRTRERGEAQSFQIFLAYDTPKGDRPSYRALAERFDIPDHEVWRTLEAVRTELRLVLLERVTEYVSSEAELFKELDDLFSP